MLQTRKINKDTVAVSFEPTEILLRKSGKSYFGTETPLARVKDNKLIIDKKAAEKFGIEVLVS